MNENLQTAYAQSAQVTATSPQPANTVEGMIVSLDSAIDGAERLADRLERVVTRAFGEQVTQAQGGDPKTLGSGAAAAVGDRLLKIMAVLNRAHEAVTKLDTFV